MKIIAEKVVRGRRRLTIEIDSGSDLVEIKDGTHYRLAEPMEDVIAGYILAGAKPVSWCSIEQKWV